MAHDKLNELRSWLTGFIISGMIQNLIECEWIFTFTKSWQWHHITRLTLTCIWPWHINTCVLAVICLIGTTFIDICNIKWQYRLFMLLVHVLLDQSFTEVIKITQSNPNQRQPYQTRITLNKVILINIASRTSLA